MPGSRYALTRGLRAAAGMALMAVVGLVHAAALDGAAARAVVESYAEIAWRNYRDAWESATALQSAIHRFLEAPSEDGLAAAREAWLSARPSYGQSEVFRFYEGPIDFGRREDGTEGPEGRINAWPLNEAWIDGVRGDPGAGVINDPAIPLSRASLIERNARDDEANVTTGYHAIEFLLWGQDFSDWGPGSRPATDFIGGGAAERRRIYLNLVTDLLVEDLQALVEAWAPDAANYRAQFLAMDPQESLGHLLTGAATLSGFELAAERLATALDSASQEDEQSCFSDSTHQDILANALGVENVWLGRYGDYRGTGVDTLLSAVDAELASRLDRQIRTSAQLARELDRPFDRILASPPGSPQRARVEALVSSLQEQADLLVEAGRRLGIEVIIASE